MSQSDESAAGRQFPKFWELPAELRVQIYRNILTEPTESTFKSWWSHYAATIDTHIYPVLRARCATPEEDSVNIWLDSVRPPRYHFNPYSQNEMEGDGTQREGTTNSCQTSILRHPFCWKDCMREKEPGSEHTSLARCGLCQTYDDQANFMLASRRTYDEAVPEYLRRLQLTCFDPGDLVDIIQRIDACGHNEFVKSIAINFTFDEFDYNFASCPTPVMNWTCWTEFLKAIKPNALLVAFPKLRSLKLQFLPVHKGLSLSFERIDEAARTEFEKFITTSFAPKFSGMGAVSVEVTGLRSESLSRWIEDGVRSGW